MWQTIKTASSLSVVCEKVNILQVKSIPRKRVRGRDRKKKSRESEISRALMPECLKHATAPYR